MIFDYETLKMLWWLIIGVLLIGFAITDGMDMGVAMLLRLVGKTDSERRTVINTIGPHWDGNQVWFITAGGALFAAWPMVYAAAFSGFYFAMMLVLFALFFRPLGFDYRSKVDSKRWRNNWDWGLLAGSAIPALVFGVAFGNLFLGVPFNIDNLMRVSYQGSFFGLLNPIWITCRFSKYYHVSCACGYVVTTSNSKCGRRAFGSIWPLFSYCVYRVICCSWFLGG